MTLPCMAQSCSVRVDTSPNTHTCLCCTPYVQACASLECDLISVDLSRRLPYRFKPALIKAALARGLHFEVGCD